MLTPRRGVGPGLKKLFTILYTGSLEKTGLQKSFLLFGNLAEECCPKGNVCVNANWGFPEAVPSATQRRLTVQGRPSQQKPGMTDLIACPGFGAAKTYKFPKMEDPNGFARIEAENRARMLRTPEHSALCERCSSESGT